jgi:hypothetical protein
MSAFMPADIERVVIPSQKFPSRSPRKIWRARNGALSLRSSSKLAVYFAVYP